MKGRVVEIGQEGEEEQSGPLHSRGIVLYSVLKRAFRKQGRNRRKHGLSVHDWELVNGWALGCKRGENHPEVVHPQTPSTNQTASGAPVVQKQSRPIPYSAGHSLRGAEPSSAAMRGGGFSPALLTRF